MMLDDSLFSLPYGLITLISGPMFSGKSEELIRLLRRAEKYANLRVQAFKPVLDNRYGGGKIISHDQFSYDAIEVQSVGDIFNKLDNSIMVIGISETQFLDDKIIDFCLEQRKLNKKIILEGLLTDYKREPFKFKNSVKSMTDLLIHVDYPIFKTAFCYKCGKPAIYTQRKIASKEQILVGGGKEYAAACSSHHTIP